MRQSDKTWKSQELIQTDAPLYILSFVAHLQVQDSGLFFNFCTNNCTAKANKPTATKLNIPEPKATKPTTKVRTAEVSRTTNWLSECIGLFAKLVAIAIISEYSAYPNPPEIIAPLTQRTGLVCICAGVSGWEIEFGSVIQFWIFDFGFWIDQQKKTQRRKQE